MRKLDILLLLMTTRKRNKQHINYENTIITPTSGVEEYNPSENADKYAVEVPRYSYRILTHNNDYIRLQEDVTKLLNDGWSLAGGVSVSIHANQYSGNTVFSQAVYRLS